MTVDKEIVKKALGDFTDDKYVEARDALRGQIRQKRDDFLKNKLGLEKDIGGDPTPDDSPGGDDGDE